MRRPPAYVGRVQTEGAVDPAAVAQRAGQAAPQVSTATQVSPPADPDEPLFQALPREGGADGARVAPPSVVHNAQPVQHDNKSQPAPRVARKVSGRQAKVSLASTEGRSQPVMKAARVRGAKFATRTAERRAKHAGTQKAKQPGKQAHQQLAAQKTKRKGKSASAARRAPKAKSGVRVAAARQPSRSTARIQKAKATTSRQASAAQRPSAMKQPRRSAVSRKEPQARRLVAPKAG